MVEKRIVPFIADEKLIEAVRRVVSRAKSKLDKAEKTLDKNVLDPFSALFESIINGIEPEEWLLQERGRQIQKTIQQAVGDFHQEIIGGIDGWENMGKGHLVDVRNMEKKIVAEVKSKHNTVTGQHLPRIYDELKHALDQAQYKGFTGYFIHMVPKKKEHTKYFTPSDNRKKKNRPQNNNIIEISGWLFYDIATGQKDSLYTLYSALPRVLKEHCSCDPKSFGSQQIVKGIFNRTYKDAV